MIVHFYLLPLPYVCLSSGCYHIELGPFCKQWPLAPGSFLTWLLSGVRKPWCFCCEICSPFLSYPLFSFFHILVAVMTPFPRKSRKSRKGRVLGCPFSFSSPVRHLPVPCSFELRFCFASCLLNCNSGPHPRPGSPETWMITFTLRARRERLKKEEIQHSTLQRTEPESL